MLFTKRNAARAAAAAGSVTLLSLGLMACAPSSGGAAPESDGENEAVELGISDEDYSLDKLIEAAKEEGPIVVSDSTGKIVDIAEAFSEKYGLDATGVKVKAGEAAEIAIRESEADNVKTDLLIFSDSPAAKGELLERGIVSSWTPPDLADKFDPEMTDPQVVTTSVMVWAYNAELYPDGCPIDNVWAVTDEDWRGHVTFEDPTLEVQILYWVNQMAENDDDALKDAYEEYFGEEFSSDEDSAAAEWLKRLAQNEPVLTKGDDEAAAAAGAPGQKEAFMALLSTAKFRDNADSGYKLGMCEHVAPYSGIGYNKLGLIANGTKNPNTAKLFLHYMLTEEGISLQVEDGKFSANNDVEPAPDEPSGIADIWDEVYQPNKDTQISDYEKLPDWSDFWIANNHS
ncbi:ABC transporter substrate-binding protein [Microbacterium bovistercoris]|uniref:ABC transporter substrate-binding protein n=1 Tax=Microbacterium bovistercoris TaxID=2293570 RepID=A0A371NWB4_9MICO|nr:ABC transporter substrate-binding protein [Microbacterium bovistercoris]REJ07239.1 ABC transporter substrate-binding protein [Microbacterium bovistercoris]